MKISRHGGFASTLIIVIVTLLLGIGVTYVLMKNLEDIKVSHVNADTTKVLGPVSCKQDTPAESFMHDWTFVKMQNTRDYKVPYTRVLLDTGLKCEDGKTVHVKSDLGIHKGVCEVLPVVDVNLAKNGMPIRQVARAQCVFDGSGEEIGLYRAEFEEIAKIRKITVGKNTKPAIEEMKDIDEYLFVD